MVIRLSVRTRVDLEALEAGLSLLLIRITANVRILTSSGWSHSRVGILDTAIRSRSSPAAFGPGPPLIS